MPGLIFLFITLAAIVAIALAVINHRTIVNQWSRAAADLGLDLNPGGTLSYPRMEGTLSGHDVSVHTFTSGGGNNQQRYTRFELAYPSLDLGLELSRQTKVGGFFRRIVGMQDVEIGDPSFDEAFVVKTIHHDRLSAYLTGQRRSTLGRLLATYPTLKVTDTSVRVDLRRVVRDPDLLVSTVRRLVGVGRSLSSAGAEADEAVTARAAGELGEALRRMREAVEARPDDVERRLQELDTLAAAGKDDDMGARVEELERLAPADPEVLGWKQSLASPSAPPSESRIDETPTVEADAAAQDLFGTRELSFAVRDRFAADYAGRPVRWSGTVSQARSYERDHDFGKGPGVKAVVAVAELQHDLFGSTEVDAIVEFAGSNAVPAKGSRIAFEGTLTAVDPLMRNFTVRGASLT